MTAPAVLGRYRLDAVLGRGAMGTVHRGFDPAIGRPVAIKVMRTDHIEPAERAELLQRFVQEVRAAAGCTHPAIVAVHDVGGDLDGVGTAPPFIVMELVAGGSLAEHLAARAPIAPLDVLLPVLDALATVHRAGIVHRDVKPANILLGTDGRAKLTDFGIARLGRATERAGLTQTGMMIGTPAYMAPEQARGEIADHRADLFAVGCILHEMLTGRTPFGRDAIGPTLLALLGAEPAALEGVAPQYRDVLARALAKQPGDRFASAADFATALARVSDARSAPDVTLQAAPLRAEAEPFDRGYLTGVGAALVTHLGPISGTLVRRAAAETRTRDALLQRLAAHLDPAQRAAFLRDATHAHDAGTAPLAADAWPRADALAAARNLLRHEVGPIADLAVRRAAAATTSASRFADLLATQLHLDAASSARLHDAVRSA
jgi:eukaryotic-like serine/threonine-protein kinase